MNETKYDDAKTVYVVRRPIPGKLGCLYVGKCLESAMMAQFEHEDARIVKIQVPKED